MRLSFFIRKPGRRKDGKYLVTFDLFLPPYRLPGKKFTSYSLGEFNHLLLSKGLLYRSMLVIQYPEPVFQIKKTGEDALIFDPLRKKWLLLTPEEWVRQNFVQYLVQVKKYPPSLIAMEKMIRLGELKKRFDILVYDQHHAPWMMIECKAPSVKLDETVLHQLLRYHISVPAGFLVISNGSYTYGWQKKDQGLELIGELPEWKTAD